MAAEENKESSSKLPDNLLALPLWAAVTALGLLSAGVVVGFIFLLTPLGEAERTAGSGLLVISLPVLSVAIGILGASWARTERIDSMVAGFLRHTVRKKLEIYLVGTKSDKVGDTPYPPLFNRIETFSRSSISSYCHFHLFDDKERRFDILVKSNVFNFEIAFYLHLAAPPAGYTDAHREQSFDYESLKDWSVAATQNPLIALATGTMHGSIAEGYTVYVQARPDENGGIVATYRLRQKLQSNFLTSPYLRRYFSEDAALASYYFFAEALAKGGSTILGGAASYY
ncbi:hypothetical protein [Mycobacterium terramassiliense]|uniref:Mycobacterium terramassiliense ORFan n=1 Tax=Mycobacterium terramassiliense TaxID=1841859 RepID=A0A2U3NJC7_9MYCO|nr:hypothetical protein [Mycobacterium terramassiliense]SPM31523.1 Mycobacterium terramassiliense ORFan [Mycobacterium terramassiliense]